MLFQTEHKEKCFTPRTKINKCYEIQNIQDVTILQYYSITVLKTSSVKSLKMLPERTIKSCFLLQITASSQYQ
jgi:hypothetical protein